ncbi:MAG: anti-sigma regulatory factor [Myxococcota bacterium]
MSADGIRVRIRGEMDVSRAVLESRRFAQELGFAEAPSLMISTAVSELARNILRHGGGRGEIRVARARHFGSLGVRLEASDRGPGIADVSEALKDHYSSAGTLGLGLPGVKRMMDEFTIDSAPGEGTRVTACKWMAR